MVVLGKSLLDHWNEEHLSFEANNKKKTVQKSTVNSNLPAKGGEANTSVATVLKMKSITASSCQNS